MKIAIIDDERPARSELKYQLHELLPDATIMEGDDYVMKPYDKARLQKVLHKCLSTKKNIPDNTVGDVSTPKRISISSDGKLIFENLDNIIYIETYNRGCKIYTTKKVYYESKAIGEYEKRLNNTHFFRVHKSYIINLDKVREIFPWGKNSFCLRMRGYEDTMIPIARDKAKTLRHLLEEGY